MDRPVLNLALPPTVSGAALLAAHGPSLPTHATDQSPLTLLTLLALFLVDTPMLDLALPPTVPGAAPLAAHGPDLPCTLDTQLQLGLHPSLIVDALQYLFWAKPMKNVLIEPNYGIHSML